MVMGIIGTYLTNSKPFLCANSIAKVAGSPNFCSSSSVMFHFLFHRGSLLHSMIGLALAGDSETGAPAQ